MISGGATSRLTLLARYLGRPWVLYNREVLLKEILKGLEDLSAARIVDIGCGDGGYLDIFSFQFNPSLVIGVDLSQDELRLAKHHILSPSVELVRADAYTLPFRKEAFNLVFSKDLLHHLNDPCKVLMNFKRF